MSEESYRPDFPPPVPSVPSVPSAPLAFDEEPISPEDAAVLDELARLQHQQPSWWDAVALLAVSLFLFMGATGTTSGWDALLYLVPVLAFHELGHYVAMRFFGYRNLRMFFIPFFGAAVTGRHYNVEGWKKAVVALMGPVPGILLAMPCGITGLIVGQPWLVQLASSLLILNGFNLLPFLPIDGGWVVHAMLFVRHPVLDAVFRLLTALALIGVAVLLQAWLLTALGVVMLLGIPFAWRLARIAYDLGQRGVVALSLDADTIPPEAALPILAEVRKVTPPQTTPRLLAQNVASVFETLNAYPPGVLVSIGLLTVHAGSFLVALVLSVVLMVLQHQPG